jgi:hypothetical protein
MRLHGIIIALVFMVIVGNYPAICGFCTRVARVPNGRESYIEQYRTCTGWWFGKKCYIKTRCAYRTRYITKVVTECCPGWTCPNCDVPTGPTFELMREPGSALCSPRPPIRTPAPPPPPPTPKPGPQRCLREPCYIEP